MTCQNQPATTGAAQTSLARPAFRGGTHLHTQPAGPSDPSALRKVHRGSHEIPVTSLQQTPRPHGSDPRTFRQDTRPRGSDKRLHAAGAQAAPHPGCPGARTGPADWPLAPLPASRPTGAGVTSAGMPKPTLPAFWAPPSGPQFRPPSQPFPDAGRTMYQKPSFRARLMGTERESRIPHLNRKTNRKPGWPLAALNIRVKRVLYYTSRSLNAASTLFPLSCSC